MIPIDLTYDFPQAAYLLFLLPLLLWLFWRLSFHRKEALLKYSEQNTLQKLLYPRSTIAYWLRSLSLCAAFVFAVLALMQPKGNARYPSNAPEAAKTPVENLALQRKRHDIFFLVDASASMGIQDVPSGKSRLDYAKDIADEIASRLTGENAALYAFTSVLSRMSPLTMDYLFVRLMLKQIQINEGGIPGTDIAGALAKVRDENFKVPSNHLKTVILLSDGGDTAIEALQGADRDKAVEAVMNLFNNSEALHLRVYTIGIGSRTGSQVPGVAFEGKPVTSALDAYLLQRLCQRGRGEYIEANTASVVDIANQIMSSMSQDNPFVEETASKRPLTLETQYKVYTYYFAIPLGFSLAFLLLGLFLPQTLSWVKNWKRALPIFLAISSQASGDLPPYANQQMNQASRFVEANAYPQALETYQGLLEFPLDPFEKAVISYDIGNVYLEKGDWDRAVSQYQKILENKSFPPLIARPLYTNLAIAQYQRAKSLIEQMEKSASPADVFKQSRFLFVDALDGLQQAYQADCALEKEEGRADCPSPLDLDELREAIKREFADLLQKGREELVKLVTLSEGIPFLFSAIDSLANNVAFLDEVPDDMKNSYQKYFVAEADSWIPLWMALKEKYPHPQNQNPKEEKQFSTYEEARKLYQLAIRDLEKGRNEQSQQALKEAKQKLKDFTHLLWGADTLHQLFSVLLSDYEMVLLHEILQEPEIAGLKQEQEQLFEFASDKLPLTDPFVKQKIDEIRADLDASLDQITKGIPWSPRLYILKGMQALKRLLWHIEKSEEAASTLQRAIEEEEYALNLNRLWLVSGGTAIKKAAFADLLKQAERDALTQANPFLEEVKKQQIKEFESVLKPQQPDLRCQCTPWDEVLPLFHEGYQGAQNAALLLANPSKGSRKAMALQEVSIKKWKEALKKMKEPKKPRKEKAPQKQEVQKEANQPPPIPMQQNLQLLQEMESEDTFARPKPQITQQVLRPW